MSTCLVPNQGMFASGMSPSGQDGGTDRRARLWALGCAAVKAAAFGVLILSTFPKLGPAPWTGGLDASWMAGISQATAQGMVFGRDVAFTYGPLGFLFFPAPGEPGRLLAAWMAFTLSTYALWWLAVGLNASRCRGFVATGLFLTTQVLAGINFTPGHVMLAALVGLLWYSWQKESLVWSIPAAWTAGVALLTKFNFGVAAAVSLGVWACLSLVRRPGKTRAVRLGLLLSFSAATAVGLFLIFGGPPGALIPFLKYSFLIAGGYSSQASSEGPLWELILALAQVTLLGVLTLQGARQDRRYLVLAFVAAAPLFFMFKNGFVRTGGMSANFFFCTVAGLVGYFLVLPRGTWEKTAVVLTVSAVFLMTFCWKLSVPDRLIDTPVKEGLAHLKALPALPAVWKATAQLSEDNKREQRLPPAVLAKIGPQPVDAYPWDIAIPLASGLNWSPRPVFQSYQAYSPELDELNARHYRSANGPAYIIFGHKAVDRQCPSLVDPLTWLELFRWYDLEKDSLGSFVTWNTGEKSELLLMKRRPSPRLGQPRRLGEKVLKLGERWEVPAPAGELILLQAHFRFTTKGAFRDLLFKNYPPNIKIEFRNGATATYRLVWRNAASGFLVSDVPQDLAQVRSL